jgi:hypothetical protein
LDEIAIAILIGEDRLPGLIEIGLDLFADLSQTGAQVRPQLSAETLAGRR